MKIPVAIAALFACLLPLGACVSTQQNQPRIGFTRGDGRLISADEKLKKQFLKDWAICKAETDKVALTVPPIYWRGIGGMISASIVQQKQIAAPWTSPRAAWRSGGTSLVPCRKAGYRSLLRADISRRWWAVSQL
jgi:hypothetical protein